MLGISSEHESDAVARSGRNQDRVSVLRRPIGSQAKATRTKKSCLFGIVSFAGLSRMVRSQGASATWMAKSTEALERLKELKIKPLGEKKPWKRIRESQKARLWRRACMEMPVRR